MTRVFLVCEARGFGGAEVYLERLALGLPAGEATLAVPDREPLRAWGDRAGRRGVAVVPWSSTGALLRAARDASPDLVHVNLPSTYDGGSGWLAWRLRRALQRPIVTTEHLTRLPRSRRRRWLKLRTAGALGAVIVVSRASREALLAEGMPEKLVTVVPNGVPDPGEPRPPASPDGTLRLGVLGSLEARKRVELVIEALALPAAGAARLEVAGEGELRAELEALAARRGVADRVRFLGRVEDPAAFLASVDLLALPSRLEGMPYAALEALACGRGVLACDVPGMAEVVEEGMTGRLLPAEPAAWAEAIGALARERGVLGAWSAEARRAYLERFTLERCVEATRAVYARALAGGAR